MSPEKVTIQDLIQKKSQGQKITMLTAYDYPFARLVDQAGVDIVLVGDSLANVVLGLESTTDVGMFEMLHHTKAVRRGVQRALLIGDMPYESYQQRPEDAVANARRFVEEAGCDAVKLEWFDQCVDVARAIVQVGIPVMGHVGLTPQTAEKFRVQGRDLESARAIMRHARALEACGCFSIVLECVPVELAQCITDDLKIITIGIGAGPECDGQVLVTPDLLGLYDRFQPRFAKRYANIGADVLESLKRYCADVSGGEFPSSEHSFYLPDDQIDMLDQLELEEGE